VDVPKADNVFDYRYNKNGLEAKRLDFCVALDSE